jgi:hypothetical protein
MKQIKKKKNNVYFVLLVFANFALLLFVHLVYFTLSFPIHFVPQKADTRYV